MINILERFHVVGYVYNDLNLENLYLDYGIENTKLDCSKDDIFDDHSIKVVDLSFASRYITEISK